MTYEIEVVRKVYDNHVGKCIEVGPDKDGLGLVEVDGGDDWGRLVLPSQHAALLAKAIADCAADMEAKATAST